MHTSQIQYSAELPDLSRATTAQQAAKVKSSPRARNVCFLVHFCRKDLCRYSLFPAVSTTKSLDSFKVFLVTLH
ncbi:hypothetical protein DPMN_024722 [Dreissena polymorpha]|uniref:Uncharacterized protein n=1 Tax=Dreissena polymorpha TaxID=45954 RepID=A0A9D4LN05_DREPO|nr:hypothetical protein DPMN_024722 [Dreissena polymorpha]